jgi:hypothetical protein
MKKPLSAQRRAAYAYNVTLRRRLRRVRPQLVHVATERNRILCVCTNVRTARRITAALEIQATFEERLGEARLAARS